MTDDQIRYDLLAQEALRGVVRKVLTDVAKKGLPGEHHFFISFDTRARGVRISTRLREQHPEEMTVVLQHQFWDLTVTEHGFEVGLSFKGVPERLVVPFEAIRGFFDPSVKFGLKFEASAEGPAPAEGEGGATVPAGERTAKPRRTQRTGGKTAADAPPVAPAANSDPAKPAEPSEKAEQPGNGAEVVQLDRFRKK